MLSCNAKRRVFSDLVYSHSSVTKNIRGVSYPSKASSGWKGELVDKGGCAELIYKFSYAYGFSWWMGF